MSLRAERMIAFRYLRPARGDGFVSVIALFSLLGIMLGVGTLIVVLAVMDGFRAELLGKILGVNGHMTVRAGPDGLDDFDQTTLRVREIDGVLRALPYVEGQAMASANEVSGGALVRGLRAEDLAQNHAVGGALILGSFRGLDQGGVAIGSRMAGRMGLGVGDRLTLISPKGVVTAFGTAPRIASYDVAAIFEIGMFQYDDGIVFMGLEDAQAYFNLVDRASAIEVMVEDPERVEIVRARAAEALAGLPGRLVDWKQTNSHFFAALETERNVMFLILTLIILVAAFNIITSLTMLVRSKQSDIAILRTMGASRGAIMRIFFVNGASIGVLGALLGLAAGLAFALNIDSIRLWLEGMTGAELWAAEIRFLSRLPAKVEQEDVIAVVSMALILSFLATIYPALKAARLDPVEALRRE